jgi:hypothetical protein
MKIDPDDPAAVAHQNERVRSIIQHMLASSLQKRGNPFVDRDDAPASPRAWT